jgi:hypothetical protein
MARIRKRTVRPFEVEKTAFAYVRCGVTRNWVNKFDELDRRVLSRGNHNELVNGQWKLIRRYVRKHELELRRRFFDAEGNAEVLHTPLALPCRRELAALFIEATRLGVRTILVDSGVRLDEDDVVRAVLCESFRDAGIRVIEAATGQELTADESVGGGAHDDHRRWKQARRLVGRWKWLVTRMRSGSDLGRKPFGTSADEEEGLDRLRELCRVSPRANWRRRGKTVIKRRSFREIATILNAESVPTRTGRPWSGPVVFGILKRLGLTEPLAVGK